MRRLTTLILFLFFAATSGAQVGVGVGVYRGPYGGPYYYGGWPGPYFGYVPGAYRGFWSNGYSLYGPPVPTYGSIPGYFGGSDQRLGNFPDLRYWWPGPYGYGYGYGRGVYVPLNRRGDAVYAAPLASCELRLPTDDAEVIINGTKIDGAGNARQFTSAVPPGVGSSCEIEVRWSTPESIGSARRTVILRAGETAVADFVTPGN